MRIYSLFSMALLVLLCGCGGGGSSDSGTVIEGTLTEAGGVAHKAFVASKHGEGEKIGSVEICALGECSTTDDNGQWGFLAPASFAGGEVLFTIKGHGIDDTAVFDIPAGASDVELDLQHVEGGEIVAYHITVDGVEQHMEPEGHSDEAEGEHDHE